MHQTINTEVKALKQEAISMQDWKLTMDDASTQAAAVLEDLEDQFEDIRCLLLSVNASIDFMSHDGQVPPAVWLLLLTI